MPKRRHPASHASATEALSAPRARAGDQTLCSCQVGAMPILNHLLKRMRLEEILRSHLPAEDRRTRLSPTKALLVLLRNLLVSREPVYGMGEWAARHAPDLLGLLPGEIRLLNDDRMGRALDWLFLVDLPSLVLEVVRHVVKEFDVLLDELHNDSTTRFTLHYEIDLARVAAESLTDGVFPLVTNVMEFSELELLHAYKRQPTIEMRFSQLKTDFAVAPVYLKQVRRIQALLCMYFFALLVEALLERELRQAMQREKIEALPMYPEGRACKWPIARRLIDLFESVQRHTLVHRKDPPETMITEFSRLQRKLLRLIGLSVTNYGR